MKHLITALVTLSLVGCSKDLEDDSFIGTWDVKVQSYFQATLEAEEHLVSEGECLYTFTSDGQMLSECNGASSAYYWYYRDSPKEIFLTEIDGAPFPTQVTWSIIECGRNRQVWENTLGHNGTNINTYRHTLDRR